MRRTFDFTGENDYAIADEGIQTATVEEITEETSKNGNPMVLFKLRTKNGGLLYHYCLDLEKKRWMLKRTLEAITGQKQPSGPVTIDFDNLIGERIKVEVFHEDYAGQTRAKVGNVIVPEDPGKVKADEFDGEDVVGDGPCPF
jgi:hypothetical protein